MFASLSARFRNISTIMDCVTCEKCRLWGKVQILGFGTAIKVLLTPEEELVESCAVKLEALSTDGTGSSSGEGGGNKVSPFTKKLLNRQEIIGLLNTLNQLAKSIEFVANIKLQTDTLQEVTTRSAVRADSSAAVTEVTVTEAVARESSSVAVESADTESEQQKVVVSVQDTVQLSVTAEVASTDNAAEIAPESVAVTAEQNADHLGETAEEAETAQPVEQQPSSRKKPMYTHSPGYRKTLFGIFVAFTAVGFSLLLYSSWDSIKKSSSS